MKRILKNSLTFALIFTLILTFTACSLDTVLDKMPWNKNKSTDSEVLWENAIYTENCEFGNGKKTLTVKVEQNDNSVTFTIHTDKDTVGAALIEHSLIEGEDGAYGLYIKKVNGITADYDVDQSYWSFYVGDDYAMAGVDTTKIEEGKIYRLVYSK